MEYRVELESLDDFEFWSGAKETYKVIEELGLENEAFEYMEECLENPTETEINDFMWFYMDDWIEEHTPDEDTDEETEK